MAHIYGQSGAEKMLLRECPPEVQNFKDIRISLEKSRNKLENEKKNFFESLPNRITSEKGKLNILVNKENDAEEFWTKKINEIKGDILNLKLSIKNKYRLHLIFLVFGDIIKLFIIKNISKPSTMKVIKKEITVQKNLIFLLETEPITLFEREKQILIHNKNHLERNVASPNYSGAYGELHVLDTLRMLNNEYHIFCDVNISLNDYIRYQGNRNLKSAQMDFVVVGPSGIFVIEVKNWSSNYVNQYTKISPHEQIDRAGLVLWVFLKNHSFFFKPRITKILVSIQHNLRYDQNYRSVLIRDVSNLVQFITHNNNSLSESEIRKVVSLLN